MTSSAPSAGDAVAGEPYARESAVAASAARAAGRAVLRWYGRATEMVKEGGSPVSEADHAANGALLAALQEHFPQDAVLSEESRDRPERLAAERVWIVDPLDGTREFLSGIAEFSVMIALAVSGRPVLGVVYEPVSGRMFRAQRGRGAWLEEDGAVRRLRPPPAQRPPRLVGSRSHADPLVARIRDALGITDEQPSGSVGVKCARIALGERDLYVHPVPYLKEWDTCAPEVILQEAGGTVTDCRGRPLEYNKPHPVQPDGILAAAPGTDASILEMVRRIYAER
ncbi:MAG TPA: 3'(2'),5'-bisphosphate nucleotidase CysQ [Gemmatimonadaceae bacterium]|nr:3'(2'),5'-bisphosphate nucleotidase CysQ [Gemmatimonadaceae bacterium]